MLKINKKSWHYKIFYHFITTCCEYSTRENYIYSDKQISLCDYMKFVIVGLLFFLVEKGASLICSIIWLCLWPFAASLALIHGFLPKTWSTDGWVPYKPFIKIKNNHYHLSHFIVPMICAIVSIYLIINFPLPPNPEPFIYFTFAIFLLTIVTVEVCGTFASFNVENISLRYFDLHHLPKKVKKIEGTAKTPNIFFEYIKAKKQKVCPLIKFED